MYKIMKNYKLKFIEIAQRRQHYALTFHFVKWIFLGSIVGILSGCASAFFLTSLEFVTKQRIEHPWFLFLLPLGGAFVSFLYSKYGRDSSKGNNLILEQIHKGDGVIPLRMGFLVLIGTLISHLFGGSVGREGTAVQMGGSLSEWISRLFKVDKTDRRILLMSGISSGFGSVFGTPLAGTIFGMEVIALGTMRYEALIPCFTASFVGNLVTSNVWKIHHTHYPLITVPEPSVIVILKIIIASILFGLASILFCELTHGFKRLFMKYFKNPMIKSAVGGVVVIALVYIVGTRDYIGLGVPMILKSFHETVPNFAFFWKTLFTSLTLGAGFQGGEVTPLFFIGSTLGNTLSGILHLNPAFLGSLGFVAVFAGAANTPITCFILGIELFGGQGLIYYFMACIISYLFSGHHGIYTSQMIGMTKSKLIKVSEGDVLSTKRMKT